MALIQANSADGRSAVSGKVQSAAAVMSAAGRGLRLRPAAFRRKSSGQGFASAL